MSPKRSQNNGNDRETNAHCKVGYSTSHLNKYNLSKVLVRVSTCARVCNYYVQENSAYNTATDRILGRNVADVACTPGLKVADKHCSEKWGTI